VLNDDIHIQILFPIIRVASDYPKASLMLYTQSPISAIFANQCVTVILLSVRAPIKLFYDSLNICATFQVFSVEVAALFGVL